MLILPTLLITLQGAFSSSLAEYAMMACLYFAKEIQVLQAQQKQANWNPIYVQEIRSTHCDQSDR